MTTQKEGSNPLLRIAKDAARPVYRALRRFISERLPVIYRDGTRYDDLAAEIRAMRPRTIVEIGTCRGDNAERMLRLALWYGPADYYGFDLFEDMDGDTFGREAALWPATIENVSRRLKDIVLRGRRPGVSLFKGDTAVTLRKEAPGIGKADIIFIDGGHSYETVRSDWENSIPLARPGTVIYFDDYPNWGVGRLVDEIDRSRWNVEIIAPGDYFRHTDPPLNCRFARVTMKDDRK